MEWLNTVFLNIVDVSLTASAVICVVLLTRLLLHRLPKKYSYLLWMVVAVRLLLPATIDSPLSLFNLGIFDRVEGAFVQMAGQNEAATGTWGQETTDANMTDYATDSGIIGKDGTEAVQANSVIRGDAAVWLIGFLLFILYGICSLVKLKKTVARAVRLHDNIYECDQIASPFVFGFVHPRIYIPFHLIEEERGYILAHEQYHISRRDYIVKLLAYVLLMVHWFNPFLYVAWFFMNRDMEMSCDEHVIAAMGNDRKQAYFLSLLSFASNMHQKIALPLGFGETDTRKRVKNILKYKTPGFWMKAAGIVVLCIVVIVSVTNRKEENAAHIFVQSAGGLDTDFIAEYSLLPEAVSYISYVEQYKAGELVSRSILSSCELTDDMRHEQYKIALKYFDTADAYGESDGMVDTLNVLDTFGGVDKSTSLKFVIASNMQAQSTLWQDGGKQVLTLDKDYIAFVSYVGDQNTTGLEAFRCENLMEDESQYEECIQKDNTTVLVHFMLSGKPLKELTQTIEEAGEVDTTSSDSVAEAQR